MIKGINFFKDKESGETTIQWSYEEGDFDHFEIQVFDEKKRKWVAYDNRNGIVKKNKSIGTNY